jgi:hypothetical protein
VLTLYHGMGRAYWELAVHQGRLRCSYEEDRVDGHRWRVVGRGGSICFTADPAIAAVYAGGDIKARRPTWPTGRWGLRNGTANTEGVVLSATFDPADLTHRPNAPGHAEYLAHAAVEVERLTVVAHVRCGRNVHAELRRAAPLPPITPELRAWVKRHRRGQTIQIRGIVTPWCLY